MPFPTPQSARRINVVWLSAALGLAVILGIGVLFFHDKPASKKMAEIQPAVEAPVAVNDPAVSAVAAVSSVVSAPVVSTNPIVAVAPAVALSAKDKVAPPKEKTVQNGKNKAPIHLVFHAESWVDIKDKSGKTVFKQVNEPDSEQWVDGTPPFSVVIGNASGVRLFYEGEEIGLKEFTDIEVARLILE